MKRQLKKCIYILNCMHKTGKVVFRITNGSAFFIYLTHQHHEKAKRNKWFCIDFYVSALGGMTAERSSRSETTNLIKKSSSLLYYYTDVGFSPESFHFGVCSILASVT